MKSREFTLARRDVCGGPARARHCKLDRSRGERRSVRQQLRAGAEIPAIRPEYHVGSAAYNIS